MRISVTSVLVIMCMFASACNPGKSSRERAEKEREQLAEDRYSLLVEQARSSVHEIDTAVGFCFGDTREQVAVKLKKLNEQPRPSNRVVGQDEVLFCGAVFKLSFEYSNGVLREMSLWGDSRDEGVHFDDGERVKAIMSVLSSSYGQPSFSAFGNGGTATKWLKNTKEVSLEVSGSLVHLKYTDLSAPMANTLEHNIRQTTVPLDQF